MKLLRAIGAFSLVGALAVVPADAAKKKGGRNVPFEQVEKKDKICFAMYTTHKKILKMTVQMYPLATGDSRQLMLEIEKDGKWQKIAETNIRENLYLTQGEVKKFKVPQNDPREVVAWNAHFRIENWDMSKTFRYRVTGLDGVAQYEGIIRRDPVDKQEIVVAAFTGNSNNNREMRPDIIKNIKVQDPDMLFFSGDQSYDHKQHLGAWLLFGRQFGEIIKDRPTVSIVDDHDVGQANIWGASGKKAASPAGPDGGYYMPPRYVKEVEFAQTSNLPDPYDSTPIKRGIGTYYTSLNIGGIDFAIIEDRKFKSGPLGLVPQQGPRPDHIRNPQYDPTSVDIKGAELLGQRQLKFLEQWGKDWRGAQMKTVLSATILSNGAHLHGSFDGRLHADMDSNGWPQTPRNKALETIRKSFSFMLAGDQHLATVFHQGVDAFGDSGFSFSVPAIVNHYPRWWYPQEKPERRIESALEFAGDYYDGFKNRVTAYAYANPGNWDEVKKTDRKTTGWATGYGIVRYNKDKRSITMECWPRFVDVTSPDAKQYPGWPITITQEQNYGRKAVAYLPTLNVKGMVDPIVQIIDESNGETVYTIRIKGTSFRPKVFKKGAYKIVVGDQINLHHTFEKVEALDPSASAEIKVLF